MCVIREKLISNPNVSMTSVFQACGGLAYGGPQFYFFK